MKQYLLFDLDGTLTDPKMGITKCVQHALKAFGIEEENLDKLEPFIGPPLLDSFQEFYGFDDEKAKLAVAKYRERFQDVGLFENQIYEGIPQMLCKLKRKGMHLAIASSKPTVFVERILEHFHIQKYFEVIVGSNLDGTRVNKSEVVQEALNQLFQGKTVDREKVYMIGDRKFDVEGAREFQVECVGVSYGYGGVKELKEAHADYIVQSVRELEEFLLRGYEEFDEKPDFFLKAWRIVSPFLVFQLVRILTGVLLFQNRWVQKYISPQNSLVLCSALGFLAAAGCISYTAIYLIRLTKKDMFLSHLKPLPKSMYLWLVIATAGIGLGLSQLLSLSGIAGRDTDYQEVASNQFSAAFFIGFVAYGLISPIAEELLFRGILYNRMRNYFDVRVAMVASAGFFALYHGNAVQIIYAFVMGILIAFGYETFGSFYVPMFMHIFLNVLAYALQQKTAGWTWLFGWPACAIMLLIGVLALILLIVQKEKS